MSRLFDKEGWSSGLSKGGEKPCEEQPAPVTVEPQEPKCDRTNVTQVDRFDKVVRIVLGFEGGYSNDPADSGGETNLGITAGTLMRAFKGNIVNHFDVKRLTLSEAKKIYREYYWKPVKCDQLPYPLDGLVFDTAVNCGCGTAVKTLQRTLDCFIDEQIEIDGGWGPQTQASLDYVLDEFPIEAICRVYQYYKTWYYWAITEKASKNKKFIWGWLRNRVIGILDRLEV